MTIRVLDAADLHAFRALHRLGLAEAPNLFIQNMDEDTKNPDSAIIAMLERGEVWGGFYGTELVAKMAIDVLPYSRLAHTRWLHELYVHPQARGTGFGTALVRAVLENAYATGATHFLLWVNSANTNAYSFYKKIGFHEAGRVAGGIIMDGHSADDVLMCLRLKHAL